jgi:hypothetical protein
MSSPFDRPSLNKPPAKNDTRFPSRVDLFNALENILWFWPELFIQSAEVGESDRLQMTLTRCVRLTGTHEGTVVIQATSELGKLMAKNLLQMDDPGPYAADAFSEFVNMFCGHLMNKIRDTEKASFRHFLPLDLPKRHWPKTPPDSSLTVGVGTHLLQIDLWLAPAAPTGQKDPA